MTTILRTVAELRAQRSLWRGQVLGVVPTMGALHDGHLSLVRRAQAECDRVVVTIFVNPRQFNNPDDLAKYPRTEAADAALLAPLGVDAIFAPAPDSVYPPGFATTISLDGVALPFEGAERPGHFAGVATVVAKLFGMTQADRAYFGEKDWQQLQVIRRMVRDLDMAVTVVGCPTLRDPDGLAQSSRNTRLQPTARGRAGVIHAALTTAAQALRAGDAAAPILAQAQAHLVAAGFARVEYLALCDGETLAPLTHTAPGARLLVAAWLDGVRLIDNIAV